MITALLTARGHNSLAGKNLRLVGGRPLLYYPAVAATRCQRIQNFFVSSEDNDILNTAAGLGFEKILRPKDLSTPKAAHEEVLRHALLVMEKRGVLPDILVVLLANSATISTRWIEACLDILESDATISAVVPVIANQDHHPFRAKTLDAEGNLTGYFSHRNGTAPSNRQELPDNFFLCHNFWVLRVCESLLGPPGEDPWGFMGLKVKPFLVEDAFDVHTESDLHKTEIWLKTGWINGKE